MATRIPHVHLEIGSRFENIDLVHLVVEESLKRLDVADDISHWVGMSVREAVANAIKHGNREDPDKKVEVEFGLEDEAIIIRVVDEGRGFDLDSVPDPRNPENLLKGDGRGIFFMRKFMDEIDYTFRPGGGTVVTLRKRLPVEPKGQPSGDPGGMVGTPEEES